MKLALVLSFLDLSLASSRVLLSFLSLFSAPGPLLWLLGVVVVWLLGHHFVIGRQCCPRHCCCCCCCPRRRCCLGVGFDGWIGFLSIRLDFRDFLSLSRGSAEKHVFSPQRQLNCIIIKADCHQLLIKFLLQLLLLLLSMPVLLGFHT